MSQNTIKALWESYQNEVIPKEAGQVQRDECKQSFYAGCAALYSILSDLDGRSDNEVDRLACNLQLELKLFMKSISRRVN